MKTNKIYPLIVILLGFGIFLLKCVKDPCEDLNNDVYIFPSVTDGTAGSYNIPNSICNCITTEGLIETCLNYPEWRLFWTRNTHQQGFDYINSNFNGFEELWNRKDAGKELIKRYIEMDAGGFDKNGPDIEIGKFTMKIVEFETLIAQNKLLIQLSDNEKYELLNEAMNKYSGKRELFEFYGTTGLGSTLAIMSRIMYYNNYEPFMNEYTRNIHLRMLVTELILADYFCEISGTEVADTVVKYAENYLSVLNGKK